MDINYSSLSTTLTSICWVLLALEGGRCLLSSRKCNWLFAPSYSTDSQQWSIRSASPIPQPHLDPWVAASALNSGSCMVVGSPQATDTVIEMEAEGDVLFSLYPSVTDLTHWKCVSHHWKITLYISTWMYMSVAKTYSFKFIGPQRNVCISLVQNAQALGGEGRLPMSKPFFMTRRNGIQPSRGGLTNPSGHSVHFSVRTSFHRFHSWAWLAVLNLLLWVSS